MERFRPTGVLEACFPRVIRFRVVAFSSLSLSLSLFLSSSLLSFAVFLSVPHMHDRFCLGAAVYSVVLIHQGRINDDEWISSLPVSVASSLRVVCAGVGDADTAVRGVFVRLQQLSIRPTSPTSLAEPLNGTHAISQPRSDIYRRQWDLSNWDIEPSVDWRCLILSEISGVDSDYIFYRL